MIRKLLATTAVATLLASGALAQETTAPAAQAPAAAPMTDQAVTAPVVKADGHLASNIMGETVYNGTGDEAENIGKVVDVVFDKDGKAEALVIGVGGFLGLGAKNVALEFSQVAWAEQNGDRWLVVPATKDELTGLPDFDRKPFDPAPAPVALDTPAPATGTDTGTGTMAPAAPAETTAQAPAETAAPVERAEGMLASNTLGESVYNGTADDAQNIGKVNDLVLTKDGKIDQVVIGVGGFLGIGEKNVAFDFDKIDWAERNGDRWLVAQASKEELEAQPAFDRTPYDPAPATTASDGTMAPADTTAENAPAMAPAAPATDQAAEAPAVPADEQAAEAPAAPADDQAAQAPATDMGTDQTETAAIDRSTLTELPVAEIRSEDLVGTTVYGANDANVGKIGDVVLSADGKVDAILIDVGGFLGIGSKEVAVGMDNLKFMTDKDGNKYLYTSFTKEQLEAQAAYDKGSYAEKRDEQRLILR